MSQLQGVPRQISLRKAPEAGMCVCVGVCVGGVSDLRPKSSISSLVSSSRAWQLRVGGCSRDIPALELGGIRRFESKRGKWAIGDP